MSSAEWAKYEEEFLERRRWFDRIALHCIDNHVVLVDFKTLPHELADDATTPEYLKDILRQMVGWGGAIPISTFYAKVAKEDKAREFFRWMASPTTCMGLFNATDDRYIIRDAVKTLAQEVLSAQLKKVSVQLYPEQVLTKFEDLVRESADLTQDLASLKLSLIHLKIQRKCHISVDGESVIIAFARDYKQARCPTPSEIQIFKLDEDAQKLWSEMRKLEGELRECKKEVEAFKQEKRETEAEELVKKRVELKRQIAMKDVEWDEIHCILSEIRQRQRNERSMKTDDWCHSLSGQRDTTMEEKLASFLHQAQAEESRAMESASTIAAETEKRERQMEKLQLMLAQDAPFEYDTYAVEETRGTKQNKPSALGAAETSEAEEKSVQDKAN